ncbi:MAG TPA: DoxX family protein [Thermomicrobiales bacterium]|jgi:putative oxidoreductase|nr:DoxX family protein [Thermomicrobiales bacterium]
MGMFSRSEARRNSRKRDLGVLVVRATVGGLLAGHGAQKLFGAFGGPGLEGTSGWLESMGFKPGTQWALLAGASEFGGGVMTAAGLMHPLGPIATIGAMVTAARVGHSGKPIWVTEGGAELPVTNIAVAFALAMVSPGRYSLDHMLGIKVPDSLAAIAAAAVGVGVLAGEAAQATADEGQGREGDAQA